jgi:hypothetical protein
MVGEVVPLRWKRGWRAARESCLKGAWVSLPVLEGIKHALMQLETNNAAASSVPESSITARAGLLDDRLANALPLRVRHARLEPAHEVGDRRPGSPRVSNMTTPHAPRARSVNVMYLPDEGKPLITLDLGRNLLSAPLLCDHRQPELFGSRSCTK